MNILPTVLVLDDNLERHAFYKNLYKDSHFYVETHNAHEAIEKLNNEERFDLLHLDYDLYELPSPEPYLTGMAVVEHILDFTKFNPEKRPKNIIIHSLNSKGALLMKQKLKNNGIKPKLVPFPLESLPWWNDA